jgi:carboxymethylenebutenolidase
MGDLWEEHTAHEFGDNSTEEALTTMTDDPVNIIVPLLTGGVRLEEVRRYYSEHTIPTNNHPETEVRLHPRTVGGERVGDQMRLGFTHTTRMDWMPSGVPPTGSRV